LERREWYMFHMFWSVTWATIMPILLQIACSTACPFSRQNRAPRLQTAAGLHKSDSLLT